MKKILYGLICVFMAALYFAVPVSATINPNYGNVIELTPLEISEFSFGEINGEYLENVRFTVSGGTGGYDYALSVGILAADGSLEGSKEFYQSSATLGQEVVLNCNLQNRLDSYGAYVLILNVWKYYGELEINDSAIANGTFSYVNPNTPEAIEDFRVIVDTTDHTVYIDYSDWVVRSAQSYLVSLDDGSPEIYYNILYNDELGTAILFEDNADVLVIGVSYKDNNDRQSAILSKTIELNDFITFEIDEVTTNAQAKISYNTNKEIIVKVYVSKGHIFNPEQENESFHEIKLSGEGFFSVNLYEFDNLISIEYDAGNNVTIIKQALVHRGSITAPTLILPEHTGIINTSMDTFDIAGLTESRMTITINGLQIETEDDGSFIYRAELLDGENVFEVMASDGIGNTTAQNVIIIRTNTSSGNIVGSTNIIFDNIFLICSFVAACLFILFMFIFRKRFDKMWKENKPQAIINICRNISIPLFVLSVTYFGYSGLRYFISNKTVNSKEFAEAGLIDPIIMYDGILKNQINRDEFLVSVKIFTVIGLIFLSLLVASIICGVIRKAAKRRMDEKTPTKVDSSGEPDIETPSTSSISAEDTITDEPKNISENLPVESEIDESTSGIQNTEKRQPSGLICPQCGTCHETPVKFCGKCGAKI